MWGENRVTPDGWDDDNDYELQDKGDKTKNKNGRIPEKAPPKQDNFVYKRPDKKKGATGDVNAYVDKRFNQNHCWRPSLTDRKR